MAAFCLLTASAAVPAIATEPERYDRRIEMAAAERAAARLGELRGSIGPKAGGEAFFVRRKPVPLGFGLPATRRDLPPPISLDLPEAIDSTSTGSLAPAY